MELRIPSLQSFITIEMIELPPIPGQLISGHILSGFQTAATGPEVRHEPAQFLYVRTPSTEMPRPRRRTRARQLKDLR